MPERLTRIFRTMAGERSARSLSSNSRMNGTVSAESLVRPMSGTM
jgi:hypothetical protein